MYSNLEHALWRIFGLDELLIGDTPLAKEVQIGYRKSRLATEDRLTKVERITRDGQAKAQLRAVMAVMDYAVLVLRYSIDREEKLRHWQILVPSLKADKQLPKRLRSNPVMLATLMGWHIRHEDLRQNKVVFKSHSRMTTYRWNKTCKDVASQWVDQAAMMAEQRLHYLGLLREWE